MDSGYGGILGDVTTILEACKWAFMPRILIPKHNRFCKKKILPNYMNNQNATELKFDCIGVISMMKDDK